MATATIDVRVLGAGFVAKVMRRGMTTALDEVERRIARDRDKMNAAYGTDYDAAVEDCLGVVAAVRTDAESAPLPEDEAPAVTRAEFDALTAEEQERVMRETDDAIAAHLRSASPEEIAELERMLANWDARVRGEGSPR